ncbi:hypothetical protein [Bosea sp. (in: a-proteobacteria)]|uniref:hypothetical protein n=1 Tax=Bosea sp. (in: a-proteobacteria) TaxID=1871050 RepID=UPI003B3A818A
MKHLLSLWHRLAGHPARIAVRVPVIGDARRKALRAAMLEQLADSEWPCHPHF